MKKDNPSDTWRLAIAAISIILGAILTSVTRLHSSINGAYADNFNITGGFYYDLLEICGLLGVLGGLIAIVLIIRRSHRTMKQKGK